MLASLDVIEPEYTRALISLSRGGSDAAVLREFDMAHTSNSTPTGSPCLRAGTTSSWEDENTVLVGTDFGDGSLTNMGPAAAGEAVAPRRAAGAGRDDPPGGKDRRDCCAGGVDRTPGFERTAIVRGDDPLMQQPGAVRAAWHRIDAHRHPNRLGRPGIYTGSG